MTRLRRSRAQFFAGAAKKFAPRAGRSRAFGPQSMRLRRTRPGTVVAQTAVTCAREIGVGSISPWISVSTSGKNRHVRASEGEMKLLPSDAPLKDEATLRWSCLESEPEAC